MPAFLTKRDKATNAQEVQVNEKSEQEGQQTIADNTSYEYKNYGTIKLLHQKTNEVEEVPLDQYLYHVVSAEMPADFELEALKAQAIVARTYTIFKVQNKKHENADICDESTCCQAWVSKEDRMLTPERIAGADSLGLHFIHHNPTNPEATRTTV